MNLIKRIIGFYFNFLSVISPKLAGKHGFYFFCIPFKAKLKPEQQKFLDTADQQTFVVDHKKINSYSWGEGSKIILFVHGWQSNAYRWKKYIEQLDPKEYKILAFDAPGHGNSEGLISNVPLFEKSLNKVVDHYGTPYAIVSHSIGAFASMYFLHKNQVQVAKLVSLATPFTADQFVEVFQSELKVNDRVVREIRSYFKEYTGHEVSYFSLQNFAPTIDAETMIIHDLKDQSTPVENSKTLDELLKQSEIIVTDGYGHRLKNNNVINKVHEFVVA